MSLMDFLIQFKYVPFLPKKGKTGFFTVNVQDWKYEFKLSSLLPSLFLLHSDPTNTKVCEFFHVRNFSRNHLENRVSQDHFGGPEA